MAIPPNPLTKPHLDKLAGLNDTGDIAPAEEIERRVQGILNEWLKFYFSGNAFDTPVSAEANEQKTFAACEILFGRATPGTPGKLPILHTLLTDRRDDQPRRIPGRLKKVTGDWTYNIFIRTHPQLPAASTESGPAKDAATEEADRVCRRVGDQVAWLLRSAHVQELAMKGIGKVQIAAGPRPVQAGAWCLNQIIVNARITFRISDNSP